MGCCCGHDISRDIPSDWWAQFKAIKLTPSDINKLLQIYRKIDTDKSGSINLSELFRFLRLEQTSFTTRVFQIFDENGSGKVDFREFVMALWNYCTLGRATLDMFAFDLYDADESGELTNDEVALLLEDSYGENFKSNKQAQAILQEIRKIEKHGTFNMKKFVEFSQTHQALLFPAFQLQNHLQESVLGTRFWEKCSSRRIELSSGKFVSMSTLMEANLDPQLIDKFAKQDTHSGRRIKSGARVAMENTGTVHDRKMRKKGGSADTVPPRTSQPPREESNDYNPNDPRIISETPDGTRLRGTKPNGSAKYDVGKDAVNAQNKHKHTHDSNRKAHSTHQVSIDG